MRKFMMLGALVALVVAALALPALAQQNDKFFRDVPDNFGGNSSDVSDQNRAEVREDRQADRADNGFFFGGGDFDRFDAQDWSKLWLIPDASSF